jgi:hypothetical protein
MNFGFYVLSYLGYKKIKEIEVSLLVDPELNTHSPPTIGHNVRPMLLCVCVCVCVCVCERERERESM